MKHMKKSIVTLAIALALASSFILGASASSTLTAIQAYLNYGITIEYNGEAQELFDANGVRLYPISYNNSTYVPIRAVSNILGVNVDWDQARQTVVLGTPTTGVDLINKLDPYSYTNTGYKDYGYDTVKSSDGKTATIAGEQVNHWIRMYASFGYWNKPVSGYYNVGGKYGTVSFRAYCNADVTLEVRGNNDTVLASIPIKGSQVPQTYTVPLAGATQLSFSSVLPSATSLYIFDATLN